MTTNKPEVKRYTPAYGVDSVMRGYLFMEECEHGAWVSLEDHKDLQAECEKLRKAAEVSAADANEAERECSKALRTLEGLERVAKVVSDNSDSVCRENNQLRSECEKLRKVIRRLCNIYVVDDYYSGDLREKRLDRAVERAIDTALQEPTQ